MLEGWKIHLMVEESWRISKDSWRQMPQMEEEARWWVEGKSMRKVPVILLLTFMQSGELLIGHSILRNWKDLATGNLSWRNGFFVVDNFECCLVSLLIVMNSGSQLSEMSTMSLLVIVGIELFQLCVWLSSLLVMAFGWISLSLIECHHSQVAFTTLIKLNMKAFFERGGLTLYSLDIPGEVGTVRVQM